MIVTNNAVFVFLKNTTDTNNPCLLYTSDAADD